MPLLTASKAMLDEISDLIEEDPTLELTVDIEKKQLTVKQKVYPLTIQNSHRESFLKGYWNVLNLLKSNAEKVNNVAKNLPYINGY